MAFLIQISVSAANGISPGVGGGGGRWDGERTRVVASKPQEKGGKVTL